MGDITHGVYHNTCKKGDSFLLKDNEFSLLVDGGDGQTKIINHIREHTNHLDVVICTHYDGDHIKGLLNLFEYVFYYEKIIRYKISANKKDIQVMFLIISLKFFYPRGLLHLMKFGYQMFLEELHCLRDSKQKELLFPRI
ncbi:MBL fold metallo-hydrolase [Bacillus toyonensis]